MVSIITGLVLMCLVDTNRHMPHVPLIAIQAMMGRFLTKLSSRP